MGSPDVAASGIREQPCPKRPGNTDHLLILSGATAPTMTTQADTSLFCMINSADPERNGGHQEVAFVESNIADDQTLLDGFDVI
ncbi:hypothetical protein ACFSJC_01280 [Thiorhodococcus fuscus]|uniref:Uncharacterized protein n=1 Tax=Thiorhodococcus fuscus TaxID=527200 RepID=A0ABW4Y693_9GAMM